MVALLLVVGIIGQSPFHAREMDATIAQCSSDNGYAEYVRAAKLLDNKQSKDLDNWLNLVPPGHGKTRPTWFPKGASNADLQTLEAKRFDAPYKKILKANQMTVSYPIKEPTIITLHPEISLLRLAMRINARLANRAVLQGRYDEALERADAGLTMGEKLQVGGFSNVASAVLCERMAVRTAAKVLSFLGSDLVDTFTPTIRRRLATPRALVQGCTVEVQTCRNSFWALARNQPSFDDIFEELRLEKSEVQEILSIPNERKLLTYNFLAPVVEDPYLQLRARLLKPEVLWLKPFEITRQPPRPKLKNPSEQELSLFFAGKRMFEFGDDGQTEDRLRSALLAEVAARLEMRMFLKAVEVVRFRHKNRRLPKTPNEVWGKTLRDPITGGAYELRILPDGRSFEIRSKLGEKTLTL